MDEKYTTQTFSCNPIKSLTLEDVTEVVNMIKDIKPIEFNNIAMNSLTYLKLMNEANVSDFHSIYGFGIIVTEVAPNGHFFTLLGRKLVGILYPDGKYIKIKELEDG